MKKWLTNKDNLIGIAISVFFGMFGAMAVFSFDLLTLTYGLIGTLVGVCIGAAFKESRRGKHEIRPNKWYIPYIVGGVIAELITILVCVKLF